MSSNTLLINPNTIPDVRNQGVRVVKTDKQQPRESLAVNLRHLMDLNDYVEDDVARLAKVSQKTINNILNKTTSVTLDKVEAVAAVFGLSGWQLILPNLPAELAEGGSIAKLYKGYIKATPEGRQHIEMVAQREAAYSGNNGD